jgi:hypothetical protein
MMRAESPTWPARESAEGDDRGDSHAKRVPGYGLILMTRLPKPRPDLLTLPNVVT